MASNIHGEAWPVDTFNYSAQGDKIHNNIFLNHSYLSIYANGDFDQIHNNIVEMPSGVGNEGIRVGQTSIGNYRGPWRSIVYNNTVIRGARGGIAFWNKPSSATTLYSQYWCYSNILDSPQDSDSNQDISVNKYYQTAPQWDTDNGLRVKSNYFYNSQNSIFLRVLSIDYNLVAMKSASFGGLNYIHSDNNITLYKGISGADRYKTKNLTVEQTSISQGSIVSAHPYLNITLPTYIGATDPSNDGWVNIVWSLSGGAQDSPPIAPTGLGVTIIQ